MVPCPPGMERPAQLVHLRRSPAETQRLANALAADGLACEILGVADEQELCDALAANDVDVAVATLAQDFDDPAGLTRRVRRAAPHVPLIALMPADDAATEVAVLRAGAADCFAAARLSRLDWSIRRAL